MAIEIFDAEMCNIGKKPEGKKLIRIFGTNPCNSDYAVVDSDFDDLDEVKFALHKKYGSKYHLDRIEDASYMFDGEDE